MSDLDQKPAEYLEELKRRNLQGKRALVADLRRRKSDKAVAVLVDLLREESWYLRELAVEALAEMGDMAAPALNDLLVSGLWYSRAAAARALGKIGNVPGIPGLVRTLDDTNQTVQGASLASLADFVRAGHAEAVAMAFVARGPRRAEELRRLFHAVHPAAADQLTGLLITPGELAIKRARAEREKKLEIPPEPIAPK